jgi:L-ascorbate metabolism protein UlaG (beta-lactamase superfamily)
MKAGLTRQPTMEKLIQEDVVRTSGGDLKITAITHATLMFTYGGKVIHVDPVSSATDYSKLPKADLVLVAHEHGDHLDPRAIEAVSTEKTVVVASSSCVKALPKATIMNNGETDTFAGFKIEAVPAYNIVSKRPDGVLYHPKGSGNGYIITFGDKRVYVAGDTENTPEVKALQQIGVAFLPMNLPYTMTPVMAADAAKAMQPKVLYPYHYSGTDPLVLVDLLKDQQGIEVRIRDLR